MSTLPINPSPAFIRRNPHLYPKAVVFWAGGIPPAEKPARKRIRQSGKPLLNKLEEDFDAILRTRYVTVRAQSVRFRLGNGIWFKPDFFIPTRAYFFAYEVKGPFAHRGGFENLKVAASLYPEIRWVLVWKEGGRWVEQEVLP